MLQRWRQMESCCPLLGKSENYIQDANKSVVVLQRYRNIYFKWRLGLYFFKYNSFQIKSERCPPKVTAGHIIQACKHVETKAQINFDTSPFCSVVILEIHKPSSWFRNYLVFQDNINVPPHSMWWASQLQGSQVMINNARYSQNVQRVEALLKAAARFRWKRRTA